MCALERETATPPTMSRKPNARNARSSRAGAQIVADASRRLAARPPPRARRAARGGRRRALGASGEARLRQRCARSLNAGSLGAAVARDLMCEIGLGGEHTLGRAAARLRSDVAAEHRARPRERVELSGGDDAPRDLG